LRRSGGIFHVCRQWILVDPYIRRDGAGTSSRSLRPFIWPFIGW